MPDRFPSRSQKLLEEFIARGEQLDQLQTRVNGLLGAEIGLTEDFSVEGVLERLAVSARELVGAERAVARLLGPVWAQRSRTAVGDAGAPAPDPIAASGPVLAEDPPGDPSVLSVPLRAKGIVLGEVVLSPKDQRAFGAEDEEVLAALAAAAGPAVWNAVLYEESQRRQAWLEAVLDAAAELVLGGDLGFGHGLDAVADRALRASGSALAMVLLPRAGVLRIGAAAGTLPTREALIVPDPPAPAGPEVSARVGHAGEWFAGEAALGLGQVLAVRLGEGAPEGALLLLAKGDGQVYSPVDLSSATLFAGHVGLAIRLRALMQGRPRDVVSADRRRMARDLHDLVIQHLFAAGLSLQRIGPLNGQSWAEARIAEIVAELDVAVHELREAVYALGSEAGEAERDSFSAVLLQTMRQPRKSSSP